LVDVSPLKNNTNAGEISPLIEGRVDQRSYENGLKKCLNFIPLIHGPLTRRPGTMFVAPTKFSNKTTRVVRFEYSTTQAYILEFGDQYVRFFRNEGRLENPPGTPVEVATPYLEADLGGLRFVQSADTLYITHPKYAPRKLIRNSTISWTLSTITFADGPYLSINPTATTLHPTHSTGTITINASAGVFVPTDVGRLVRMLHAGTWGIATITGYTSATSVTAVVNSALGGSSATTLWRLGLWSETTGYPSCATFYEDRLMLAGSPGFPDRVCGSKSSDYENMAPTDLTGLVASNSAISFTLNATDVNAIFWMVGDSKGLLVGTAAGEWVISPSSLGEALTPTNVTAKRVTKYGSKNIAPVQTGKGAVLVQRAGRKLRDFAYNWQVDGYAADDLSVLSEHITVGGIVDMAYQAEPQSIIWAVRQDGTLLSCTYDKAQEVLGWARHRLGGDGALTDIYSAAYSKVESIATIPSSAGNADQLWAVVSRTVGGVVTKSIEYLSYLHINSEETGERFFVDSGAVYSGPPVTTVTGLTWLEGATVSILTDGAAHPNKVVSGGAITLDRAASVVHVGLGYLSDAWTLRINVDIKSGTAQGKVKRITKVMLRVFQTLGLKYGPSSEKLDTLTFRKTSDPLGKPPSYLDDDTRELLWNEGYTRSGRMYFRQDQPLPMTILAIMPVLDVQG